MASELEPALRFLEELERHHEPTLAAIRSHPFVTSVAGGNAHLEDLRRFPIAEYWYMRGGVKHFAVSIVNSPDLETQRFFHERLSGELEYSSRFRPFMEALGLTDSEMEQRSPPSEALNAVNYLFRLSVEGELLRRRRPGIWSGGFSRIHARRCGKGCPNITGYLGRR